MLATSTLLLPGAPACATRRSLPASSRVAPPTQRPQQRAGRLLARAEGQDNSEQATQQVRWRRAGGGGGGGGGGGALPPHSPVVPPAVCLCAAPG